MLINIDFFIFMCFRYILLKFPTNVVSFSVSTCQEYGNSASSNPPGIILCCKWLTLVPWHWSLYGAFVPISAHVVRNYSQPERSRRLVSGVRPPSKLLHYSWVVFSASCELILTSPFSYGKQTIPWDCYLELYRRRYLSTCQVLLLVFMHQHNIQQKRFFNGGRKS
jgi:hypothetical protein